MRNCISRVVQSCNCVSVVGRAAGLGVAFAILAAPAWSFVRVVQDGGVWWFEDGDGRRFFSLGVDCVAGCYGHYEERPLAPADRTRTVSLLREWGFNTAAAWSSPSVWDAMYFADQIYPGIEHDRIDVFDDATWTGWLRGAIRGEVEPFLGKRNFIGYFLDNEVHWNGPRLLKYYMQLPARAPGRRALVRFLEERYGGDIGRLNAAWGTGCGSFRKVPEAEIPKELPAAAARDAAVWRSRVADELYRRYAGIVREEDPNHLILGVRWSGLPALDLYEAVTKHFDVSSVNDYTRYGNLNPAYAGYYSATGKPVIITEWSFSGFPEPGRRSLQFIDVYGQKNRAFGYRKYVLAAAGAPFMVGMHWFLWSDYWPSEEKHHEYLPDGNMGLVTHDGKEAYPELTRECVRTNSEVEGVHRAAASRPSSPQTSSAEAVPRRDTDERPLKRFVPRIDGELREWPKDLAVRPELSESLLPDVHLDHTYYASWDSGTLYVAGEINDSRLDHPGRDWSWQGDYLSVILSPSGSGEERSVFVHLVPTGGGPGVGDPYGYSWGGFKDDAVIEVAVRRRRGGYAIEALIPAETLPGFGDVPGSKWNLDLNYRNVNEIYETRWYGKVVLAE